MDRTRGVHGSPATSTIAPKLLITLVPVRLASPSCRVPIVALLVVALLAVSVDVAVAAPAVRLDQRPVAIRAVEVHGAASVDTEELAAGVAAAIDRYLNVAVVKGLVQGRPGAGLPESFTVPARKRLQGPDRASLVEEGGPRPAVVFTKRARADVVALVAPSGTVEVVVVTIDHRIKGWGGSAGAITVIRTGDLVLNRAGDQWRIDAYDLRVERRREPLPPLGELLWVLS